MNKHDQQRSSDLEKVLVQEPHHEADRLREVWDLAGSNESADFPNPATIDRLWQSLDAFAESHESPPPRVDRRGSSKLRLVRLRPWMAIAATLLIGATVGVLALSMSPVVKTAAPGQRLAVTLPDGSRIELNNGTTVRYARRFGKQRIVHLEGEAFFDVVEAERPFIVHTFNARVAVLGTQFNVRAWSQSMDPGTTVTLESGHVFQQDHQNELGSTKRQFCSMQPVSLLGPWRDLGQCFGQPTRGQVCSRCRELVAA